ncbi:MAG: branched-chain amino acid ABC transporter permease [Propionibacteriaceae bacterium]|nr:branched-chain amino acid ABC transporter permease [Propionibacteriaceae bacterium]
MLRQLRPVLINGVSLVATFAIVYVLMRLGIIDSFYQDTIALVCINIVLAVSLNLIVGFTGQFSLGHAGFMALGAYTTALVTLHFPTVWGMLGGIVLGALIAAAIGFLIGLPTLRLRGDYLAIATLGMAEIIRVLMQNFTFTGGASGLFPNRYLNWTWMFILTAGSVVLIANYIRSRAGRESIAVRENEIAAESIGVNTTKAKTLAFVVGAFFGGVAGGMYGSYFYWIVPKTFSFMMSFNILVIVVLGGLGSISGSVIAAILLGVVNVLLADPNLVPIRMILYSLILIILMVFRPQGLMGDKELSIRLFRSILPKRRRPPDEGLEPSNEGWLETPEVAA